MEYREIDEESIKNIVSLWNANIGSLYPMDEKLMEQNFTGEKNKKKAAGAFENGKLIGFIIYKQMIKPSGLMKPDGTVGCINSVLVDMNYRNMGVASKLFDTAEGDLKSWGVQKISFGRDTFHFFPGVPSEFVSFRRFLSNRGYAIGDTCMDLICDISRVDFEKLPNLKLNNNPGYKYELLTSDDKSGLWRFFERCFPNRWYGDMMVFFDLGMEERDIVVLKDGKTIIGFAHIYDNESVFLGPPVYWRGLLGENYGGLGPIGVDEKYRKQGLGLTLLYNSLRILKDRGVHKMAIDWTNLIDFYGLFNFIPWKKYYEAYRGESIEHKGQKIF